MQNGSSLWKSLQKNKYIKENGLTHHDMPYFRNKEDDTPSVQQYIARGATVSTEQPKD